MKYETEIYVIDGKVLQKLQQAIEALQCVFLDIFSNYEAFSEEEED